MLLPLPLLGLATIIVLLTVIMTKRMSPLIALILIPIAAALVGGFGLGTGKFVIEGLKSLAPVSNQVKNFGPNEKPTISVSAVLPPDVYNSLPAPKK